MMNYKNKYILKLKLSIIVRFSWRSKRIIFQYVSHQDFYYLVPTASNACPAEKEAQRDMEKIALMRKRDFLWRGKIFSTWTGWGNGKERAYVELFPALKRIQAADSSPAVLKCNTGGHHWSIIAVRLHNRPPASEKVFLQRSLSFYDIPRGWAGGIGGRGGLLPVRSDAPNSSRAQPWFQKIVAMFNVEKIEVFSVKTKEKKLHL